ncbi:MAG TPA: glycosyltransferase [Candidatus Solibacter sp.]|jgi:glycosyltransferase involved in cell wall biosynthesis|nr:glycosyltransferase [Candidatus Solibacter sp.]
MTEQTATHPIYGRKLRLAIFGGRGIPSTYSGTEAFFIEIAPRLVARGHEVIVYCRKSLFRERPALYKGVRLIYLPSIETKNLGTLTHTLACMIDVLRRNVDAMLVTNVANAFHCIIPRIFRQNCAINVDGIEWKRGKWGPMGKAYFYMNAKLSGKILPKGIVTDAYEMRKLYLEEFNTRSACIAYGATIERSTNPDSVRQYGLEPGNYYLIASRLVPENNAAMIVEGFKKAPTERVLAIAGDANYRSEFVSDLKANAGNQVRFLGHVDNIEHVKELHCNAYAYIHGHMMGGTNPALLKALAYGNCILAHDNQFNAEVLGGHGLLFRDADELAEKIHLIESKPELAETYRRQAPDRIREAYTWDRITDQYEELFYQLAAGEDPTRVHSSVLVAERETTTVL